MEVGEVNFELCKTRDWLSMVYEAKKFSRLAKTYQLGWNIVVVYPVIQVYGSLALEDNLEAGEAMLDRCTISRVCTSAF